MEPGEKRDFTGPEGMGKNQPVTEWKKIINHPDLEIYWPSRVTVVGFFVAWLFVALIIMGTVFLARIGA
jgi:hypothetical protein